LQTAVIADQNGRKMWERQIVEMKSLLFLQVRSRKVVVVKNKSTKATPDAASITNQRRFLNLVCLLLLLIPKGTSQFLVQFVPVVGFFKINLFCHFLSKT